ncbi:hypothetical protein NDU88_004502 [Pleurodeles waltl]|uniref:Uncharacterized protein n=1 Tax=Pleurodeles waltl TaxID=8319 RepID=A0AAV7WS59_PLEWA|nr:hypothetical protein NDU88_004502 [Pleurodeles waltl]
MLILAKEASPDMHIVFLVSVVKQEINAAGSLEDQIQETSATQGLLCVSFVVVKQLFQLGPTYVGAIA